MENVQSVSTSTPEPALWVLKFGGTSVGSPELIRAVADRIARRRDEGHALVVVVSAMGHTTDELISLAHQVSDNPPHREMDMLLTTGERISMSLLSMALADRGVPAISLTGSQSGIITDGSHRRARILRILGDRIRGGLADGKVVIVAGFQGVSESKEITTLGRGGSDTTAVALAAALGAEGCDIFTDVDGVFTADPRVVPGAHRLAAVPHDWMVEFATRGAGVLHPRSVELAGQFGVRLRVLNSRRASGSDQGTEIGMKTESTTKSGESTAKTGRGMEASSLIGVTADRGKFLLEVTLARPGALAALWDRSSTHSLSVTAPQHSGLEVGFFGEKESWNEWKTILSRLEADGFLTGWRLLEDWIPLSLVGHRLSQDARMLARIAETLASAGASVRIGSSSALAVTFAVGESRVDDAVRALHEALVESAAAAGRENPKSSF